MNFAKLYNAAGLSVDKLAKRSGLAPATLHSWKRKDVASKGRGPTADSLRKLARGLERHGLLLVRFARLVRLRADRMDPPFASPVVAAPPEAPPPRSSPAKAAVAEPARAERQPFTKERQLGKAATKKRSTRKDKETPHETD